MKHPIHPKRFDLVNTPGPAMLPVEGATGSKPGPRSRRSRSWLSAGLSGLLLAFTAPAAWAFTPCSAITGNDEGSCALTSAGGVKCWGIPQVGDGTMNYALLPVDVAGLTDNDLALTGVPSDITVSATGPTGAVVTCTAPTAADEDGTLPTVSCAPASGSTFSIGVTSVTCTATDAEDVNSPVTASFTVTVQGAPTQLQSLLACAGGLGPGASLAAKVQEAMNDAQADNLSGACGVLSALIKQAMAQSGKQLTVTQANAIIARAMQIPLVLGCQRRPTASREGRRGAGESSAGPLLIFRSSSGPGRRGP